MTNAALRGLTTNDQHRIDAALGAWTRTGKGANVVHQNFAGWKLSKTPAGWTVTAPSGEQVGRPVSSLAFAKGVAANAGA